MARVGEAREDDAYVCVYASRDVLVWMNITAGVRFTMLQKPLCDLGDCEHGIVVTYARVLLYGHECGRLCMSMCVEVCTVELGPTERGRCVVMIVISKESSWDGGWDLVVPNVSTGDG